MLGIRWLAVSVALLAMVSISCGDDAASPDHSADDGGTKGVAGDKGSSGNPGDFASIWKRHTTAITILDTTNPTKVVDETITLPKTLTDPVDDREVDAYQQIKDDTLFTYAHLDGDDVYYKLAEELQKVDDSYAAGASTGTPHIFAIKDGHLTDTASAFSAPSSVITEAVYIKYEGKFPPSTWPSQMVESP